MSARAGKSHIVVWLQYACRGVGGMYVDARLYMKSNQKALQGLSTGGPVGQRPRAVGRYLVDDTGTHTHLGTRW